MKNSSRAKASTLAMGVAALLPLALGAACATAEPEASATATAAATAATSAADPAPAGSAGSTKQVTIPVQGMSCASCAATLKGGINDLPGVKEARVSLEKRSVSVSYEEGKLTPGAIQKKVRELGFKPGEPTASGSTP
jgi:copper chaperone CopZ